MLLKALIGLAGVVTSAQAAAVLAVRQVSPNSNTPAPQECLATVYSYITVTVTGFPNTVTIALPDYSSIAESLSRVSAIDSNVVLQNSINRPTGNLPDTSVPTFMKTIQAPAFEATEVPGSGNSPIFLPAGLPTRTVPISTFTESILISLNTQHAAAQNTGSGSGSGVLVVSPFEKSFTVPSAGWNGTYKGATNISPNTGTAPASDGGAASTVTETSFISTTTVVANTTITALPSYGDSGYGNSGYGDMVKRQTCVLISAELNNHWVSWCNNWDGSTTYSYTTWETTITPGNFEAANSTAASVATSISTTTTKSTTTTLPATVAGPLKSASPEPSMAPPSCGETGAFTINFDNLPKQSVSEGQSAGLPPIFSPYDHFYWADGWSYLPPPNDPYPPHSASQLAIYIPKGTPPTSNVGLIPFAGFGANERSALNAYWFNARSAWIGCDNNATDPSGTCDFVAEGYRYDSQTNTNRLVVTQHFHPSLCHSPSCELQQIYFQQQFADITAIGFYANIAGTLRTFYMDDIELSWANNTCEAGLLRASSRK